MGLRVLLECIGLQLGCTKQYLAVLELRLHKVDSSGLYWAALGCAGLCWVVPGFRTLLCCTWLHLFLKTDRPLENVWFAERKVENRARLLTLLTLLTLLLVLEHLHHANNLI